MFNIFLVMVCVVGIFRSVNCIFLKLFNTCRHIVLGLCFSLPRNLQPFKTENVALGLRCLSVCLLFFLNGASVYARLDAAYWKALCATLKVSGERVTVRFLIGNCNF